VRILIADDEAIIRLGLRKMLQDLGHEVVAAAPDGTSAVRLCRSLRPDLVILDIKMPGMDGLTAAEAIAAQNPIPILFLTAYSDRELVERAATLSVNAYLVKPIREEDLAPALGIAMARYGEWRALQEEAGNLEGALAARKLVDRAKHLLMQTRGFQEAEAFQYIQRRSRSQRKSMGEVAQTILESEAV
jgi:response regulator NasT